MLRKIDCVMIRVADVQAAAAYYAGSLACIPSGAEMARLVSPFQKPMLKLYFTAIQIFPRQLRSITWSTTSLRP
jgi:hypothetical protein